MIRVIINADDLGKSSEVNEAIGKALDARVITSSTIMANSTTWGEVHTIVDSNPQASFGVHLNLTEGRALTSNPVLRVAGIVDENNVFTKNVRNLPSYSDELLEAIKNEWDAQLDKVINTEGINVSHIDGHHHIHTFYPFRFILIDLLKKYGITKVRNRYNYPNGTIKSLANSAFSSLSASDLIFQFFERKKSSHRLFYLVYSSMENARWRKLLGKYATMTEYFDSYEHFCQVIQSLKPANSATIELMCHPGHPLYRNEMGMIDENSAEKNFGLTLSKQKFSCL